MQPVRRSQGGFTLIEVMIALTLTAIAVMGIVALFITQTQASGFSRRMTEAAVLAQDRVERLRTQGSAVAILPTTESNLNERGGSGGIYTRVFSETLTDPNWADITVSVSWSDDGTSQTVTMRARRTRP
jgi:prepilin-type N-terminal cleavage/methylation domain-containing protein